MICTARMFGSTIDRRYETEFEGYRLVIDAHPAHCTVFVYDPQECEVLFTGERMNVEMGKLAAVEFAATARFGLKHGLNIKLLAEMLLWDES